MNKKIILVVVLVLVLAVGWVLFSGDKMPGRENTQGTTDYNNLTNEEKLDVLESLKASNDEGEQISNEEKLEILESLKADDSGSASGGTSDGGTNGNQMSDEEKLKILESLKAQ